MCVERHRDCVGLGVAESKFLCREQPCASCRRHDYNGLGNWEDRLEPELVDLLMLLASQLGEIERRNAAKGRKGGSDSDTLRLSRKMEGILSRK